jgi:hypothetical protein
MRCWLSGPRLPSAAQIMRSTSQLSGIACSCVWAWLIANRQSPIAALNCQLPIPALQTKMGTHDRPVGPQRQAGPGSGTR